ncbi:MAG: phospho-N-acetylmuramoyl-pentapeptide-transferase [Acidobacteria bacterium RBG_13_68_16]|jgi:phospho-N-acetylmuramoyl-pentapeptide-transferase|nr:MAG: phospho-N-acetylmuramoyl-pentapeptide-transferase [Acidobacteria bacterium RBG_13_68_16]
MLYWLLYELHVVWGPLNVFRYITFRAALAILTAVVVGIALGPPLIRLLRERQIGQAIREEGPASHHAKAGTPTMGGLLILGAIVAPILLWGDLTEPWVWVVMLTTLLFGAIGLLDDLLKVRRGRNLGLRAWQKLGLQLAVALLAAVAIRLVAGNSPYAGELVAPFFKNVHVNLGILYVPFIALVLVGSSNAVNLTDGLDGLAIGSVLIAFGTYTVFTYLAGNARLARYLQIPSVPGAGEVTVFCAAMVGASLAFLWFNCHPAQLFMGDVGSLALGAAIGCTAAITKQELALVVVGGLFVAEALSVILQVVSFKTRGKRVFRMSPLHHHFELSGWAETQVVVRFWIVAGMFALMGLATLKLR